MDASPEQSKGHANEGPADGMWNKLVRHLSNWLEVYLWVPVSLLGIFGAAELTYFLTGRRPVENADWLVDYSSLAVKCIAIIAMTSIAKEALGSWMTKEEKLQNRYVYTVNSIMTLTTLILFTYVFTH